MSSEIEGKSIKTPQNNEEMSEKYEKTGQAEGSHQVSGDGKKQPSHSLAFHLAYSTILLCVFIAALDMVIVASALPAIAKDLGASSSDAYWVGTGYVLAQTASQLVLGSLSDTFGRKVVLQASLVIFLVTSILCSRAQTMRWLIGARIVRRYKSQIMCGMLILSSRHKALVVEVFFRYPVS